MKKIFANLSNKQRISIAVVVVAALAGVWMMVRHQREADFKPLFTGVAPEDAAAIVQKLKEAGVDYRLSYRRRRRAGGFRPIARNANQYGGGRGCQKQAALGSNSSIRPTWRATEFTEHINYRRALEGELERSVMSLAEVEQARVHLTFPKDSVFLESQQPAKARRHGEAEARQ